MENTETFFAAVKAGDMPRVAALLDAEPALADVRDAAGLTAVMIATYHGRRDLAALLAERRSALDIFEAAALGARDHASVLLDADPTLIDAHAADGHSPLGLACFFGHPATVALLLERGADVDRVARGAIRVRPVHAAAAGSDPEAAREIVRLLIAHGADVDARQDGDWAPLHQAAFAGNLPLVELLLDAGADLHARAADGSTPLDKAIERSHDAVAALLRAHEASPNS